MVLSIPRSSFGALVRDSCMYICGGYSHTSDNYTMHAEEFNFETGGHWILPAMPEPNQVCALVDFQ